MGLMGSMNTLQKLMDHNLFGSTWQSSVPYFDYSIIVSRTPEERASQLREDFQRFHDVNLRIGPAKVPFKGSLL